MNYVPVDSDELAGLYPDDTRHDLQQDTRQRQDNDVIESTEREKNLDDWIFWTRTRINYDD